MNVTVSLQTLLGLNDEPGRLDPYGPIPAQMARDMAANGIWRCVVVDDVHGTVLGVGKTTYSHLSGLEPSDGNEHQDEPRRPGRRRVPVRPAATRGLPHHPTRTRTRGTG